jgi:hypothetical protein
MTELREAFGTNYAWNAVDYANAYDSGGNLHCCANTPEFLLAVGKSPDAGECASDETIVDNPAGCDGEVHCIPSNNIVTDGSSIVSGWVSCDSDDCVCCNSYNYCISEDDDPANCKCPNTQRDDKEVCLTHGGCMWGRTNDGGVASTCETKFTEIETESDKYTLEFTPSDRYIKLESDMLTLYYDGFTTTIGTSNSATTNVYSCRISINNFNILNMKKLYFNCWDPSTLLVDSEVLTAFLKSETVDNVFSGLAIEGMSYSEYYPDLLACSAVYIDLTNSSFQQNIEEEEAEVFEGCQVDSELEVMEAGWDEIVGSIAELIWAGSNVEYEPESDSRAIFNTHSMDVYNLDVTF